MQRIGDILNQTGLPPRREFGYGTPEEAEWTCEVCGPVAPLFLETNSRYIRGTCACTRSEWDKLRAAKEEKARLEASQKTYSWVGDRFIATREIEALTSKTFANFKKERQPKAYEAAQAFAGLMKGTLALYGSFGTGKTHLLAALCQEMNRRGVNARFVKATTLFRTIQWRIAQNQDYSSLIQAAIYTPLFVLDDIDKAKPSEFREETYMEIFDGRVNCGLPTAISTNRLDELDRYIGGACVDRLSIGLIAEEMVGESFRQEILL